MKQIFLGHWFHWVLIVGLVALGWFSGLNRLHVIDFNPFLLVLLAIVVAILVAVLKTSPPGRQVTRDPIEDKDDDE